MIRALHRDPRLIYLLSALLAVLAVASLVGVGLRLKSRGGAAQRTIQNVNDRIRAWWVMAGFFVAALLMGEMGTVILFGCISFMALREFITLTPTSPGDHRTLFWVFFVITPIQYWLVANHWYGLFSVFIPVYAFLFIPTRNALAGDHERFLERTAKIQWGLMVCVYCISYAPALLMLEIPRFSGEDANLIFFLVAVTELSDVLQYIWGKTMGKRKIAPVISPNKTVEGFIGGVASATLLGALMWWATPFRFWEAGLLSLAICLSGFAGGLTMSAIKRDCGVKDYGNMIQGHGGVMDRMDSMCFAAPVFFHLTRYFFSV